jgi:hypothetical protein
MNKPNFQCGAQNVTVEHPVTWTVEPIHSVVNNVTLDGTHLKDTLWRKYKYTLKWDAMSNDEYDDLEALVNEHVDSNLPVTFTYEKWSQASSGVSCVMEISSRDFRGGSGNTTYYSQVSVILTELEAR